MSGVDEDLVFHMRRVQSAERDLRDLGVVWQMIESSAAISCPEEVASILPTLVHTRERFDQLQSVLVSRMADGQRAELGDELGAKAQCAIDILVRNLFERTADVGFLSTDDVVRSFCGADAATRETQRASMQRRLEEYRAKYTVYDDIALISPRGELLARLDEHGGPTHTQDPNVREALTRDGWTERFGVSDLSADASPSLRYGHRITDVGGRTIGVLVLRFRFTDEMQRIFDNVADERRQVALLLLDDDQRVIASNDPAHIPLGAKLARIDERQVALTFFGGREYIAVRCPSHGYQGYAGPGWRAQAMVSLLTAFRSREDASDEAEDVPLDQPELLAIHHDADAINRDLRRVVWNGRLMADTKVSERRRLQAVLTQVNRAGARTRARVQDAIRDLYRTSLTRARNQATELAALAADIMDRNLYERANDCRWWALSPAIQRALEEPGGPAAKRLDAVLDHINRLYTVYSRLVVFDAAGVIRGASGLEGEASWVGQSVDATWLQQVSRLGDSQSYAVSDYVDTDLHAHGPTYVYLAAIRSPSDTRRLLGGIGIVFHGPREFATMLREVIGSRVGFAAFVDAQNQVIASTDAVHTGLAVQAMRGGAQRAASGDGSRSPVQVVVLDGVHYACVRVRAKGYREFKLSDGYDNRVDALIGLRLGAAERRRGNLGDVGLEVDAAARSQGKSIELAIFHVGPMRYAIPADAVIEAVSTQGLVRTPGAAGRALGLLEVQQGERSRLVPVVCARHQFGVHYSPRSTDGVVLVLRSPQCPELPAMGLKVDDVITVLETPTSAVHPVPEGFPRHSPWVEKLFDARLAAGAGSGEGDKVLVQVLDPARIVGEVIDAGLGRSSTEPAGGSVVSSVATAM